MIGIQLFDFFLLGLALVCYLALVVIELRSIKKRLIVLTKAIGLEKSSHDETSKTHTTSHPREIPSRIIAEIGSVASLSSDIQQQSRPCTKESKQNE